MLAISVGRNYRFNVEPGNECIIETRLEGGPFAKIPGMRKYRQCVDSGQFPKNVIVFRAAPVIDDQYVLETLGDNAFSNSNKNAFRFVRRDKHGNILF